MWTILFFFFCWDLIIYKNKLDIDLYININWIKNKIYYMIYFIIINFFAVSTILSYVITTPDGASDINGLTSLQYDMTGSSTNGFYQ